LLRKFLPYNDKVTGLRIAGQEIDIMTNNSEVTKTETPPMSASPVDRLVMCPACYGDGVIDSGGVTSWDQPINLPCELCEGKGETDPARIKEAGWTIGT
jgi:DnaJ-class molecular chaperone